MSIVNLKPEEVEKGERVIVERVRLLERSRHIAPTVQVSGPHTMPTVQVSGPHTMPTVQVVSFKYISLSIITWLSWRKKNIFSDVHILVMMRTLLHVEITCIAVHNLSCSMLSLLKRIIYSDYFLFYIYIYTQRSAYLRITIWTV